MRFNSELMKDKRPAEGIPIEDLEVGKYYSLKNGGTVKVIGKDNNYSGEIYIQLSSYSSYFSAMRSSGAQYTKEDLPCIVEKLDIPEINFDVAGEVDDSGRMLILKLEGGTKGEGVYIGLGTPPKGSDVVNGYWICPENNWTGTPNGFVNLFGKLYPSGDIYKLLSGVSAVEEEDES